MPASSSWAGTTTSSFRRGGCGYGGAAFSPDSRASAARYAPQASAGSASAAMSTFTSMAARKASGREQTLEIRDGLLQPVFERHLRLPIELGLRERDVRLALLGVVLRQGPVHQA